ncbi:MAG: phenylalanine--tRNA ligase subunit beta [Chloroflexota bacterium]
MLIPLSWLQEYVSIDLSTDELAEKLTLAGLEVESIQRIGDWWDPETIRVGQVMAVHPHPDADRLVLVDMAYGDEETEQVVTGAPNLYEYKGQSRSAGDLPVLKAPFARSGAVLIDAYSDETPRPMKKLKPSKIRGIKSSGMVCSERELGLSEEHDGILLLPEDAPTGMPLREYLSQEVLELELTPDMARCLNMIGVAREVAALTGATVTLPPDECETSASPGDKQTAADYFGVRIDAPELCNRYTGTLIRNVKIGPSPNWMQERLLRAGMRPISNIVDITNYVMLEWGQPLHAFDYDILVERAKQAGDAIPTIIVDRATPNSKFTTLDQMERTMDESMLMINDTAGPVAIGGVMGGLESEVTDSTTNVLLEAATFEGINNRRTAQALRLPSEASHRFARGIPAALSPIAARRAAELMRLYAGGTVVPGMVDEYPVVQSQPLVYTTLSDVRRLLGVPLELNAVVEALETLNFQVKQVDVVAEEAHEDATFALQRQADEPLLECMPPWYRLDIRYPADLTEEVARIIGYDQVDTTLIDDVLPPQRRNPVLETEDKIRDVLVGIGLQEVINHPLTTITNHEKLVVTSSTPVTATQNRQEKSNQESPTNRDAEGFITLTNPGTQERQSMRRSMLVSVMEHLVYNLRYSRRLANFEIGRIYLPEEGNGELPFEERRLTIALTGPRELSSLYQPDDDQMMDFFDLKGIVETLLRTVGIKDETIQYLPRPNTGTYGPRCAEVQINGRSIGFIGEMHPQVCNAFGLEGSRVAVSDLLIAPLIQPDWTVEPMKAISNYPAVVEDLAFIVAEPVPVRQVEETILQAGGELLANLELFDIYRGEPLSGSEKSLAYRLTYQSPERNVSEKEVTRLRKKIVRSMEQKVKGQLRG